MRGRADAAEREGDPAAARPWWRRLPLVAAGFLCVGLGVIGIAVPLLPTAPFLLLAVACFARGSPRLHRWLVGHRVLGPYLRGGRAEGRVSRRATVVLLGVLWASLALSAFLGVPDEHAWVRILLLAMGLVVTAIVLRRRNRVP